MERCAVCGTEEFIPYICRYCGAAHCVYHRLPENHECANIQQARAPKPVLKAERRPGSSLRVLKTPRFSSTSTREIMALAVAWLVLALSFSIGFFTMRSDFAATFTPFLTFFLLILVIVGTGFIGHELAHKVVAQRLGYWAEFKLWTQGALMALLFAVAAKVAFGGPFVFAAPGAVYIVSRSGYFGSGVDARTGGIVSAMGPVVNILAASAFGVAMAATAIQGIVLDSTVKWFLTQGIWINLWLGAFNMLPVYVLDGQKVFYWNKTVWAVLTVSLWIAVFTVLTSLR